ncbi:hypothetical protein [Microvirga brassicacearum]|uniref:hypothetical protein n=1 Tax=Microvirga brassicacearum TaxID=2580413 RepID=UPI001292FF56|nr:hypothetical protein [Microvirga brassicacearum]
MKQIALTLVAAALMAGCVSSNTTSQEPNYVQAQIYQSPAPIGNTLGDNSMSPAVGGPR